MRENLHDVLGEAHEVLAFMAIALILLHIAAAVKHHRTDGVFLRRMMSSKKKTD